MPFHIQRTTRREPVHPRRGHAVLQVPPPHSPTLLNTAAQVTDGGHGVGAQSQAVPMWLSRRGWISVVGIFFK